MLAHKAEQRHRLHRGDQGPQPSSDEQTDDPGLHLLLAEIVSVGLTEQAAKDKKLDFGSVDFLSLVMARPLLLARTRDW